MSGAASLAYVDDGAPLTANAFLSSIAFEKVRAGVPFPAIQRHTRSELLLSDFAFIDSGECTIHPAGQYASPDVVRTSAHQYTLASSSSILLTLTCVTRASLSQGHIAARRPRGEAARELAPAHQPALQLPRPFAGLSRSARRTKCVGR
jgi:hypothetical protein